MGSLENLDFHLLEGSLVLPVKHLEDTQVLILNHLEPHTLSVLRLNPLL